MKPNELKIENEELKNKINALKKEKEENYYFKRCCELEEKLKAIKAIISVM